VAYLIDEQLPRTLLGIDAACRKAAEQGIVAQHSIRVVDKSRNYVITAEALVERRVVISVIHL